MISTNRNQNVGSINGLSFFRIFLKYMKSKNSVARNSILILIINRQSGIGLTVYLF